MRSTIVAALVFAADSALAQQREPPSDETANETGCGRRGVTGNGGTHHALFIGTPDAACSAW